MRDRKITRNTMRPWRASKSSARVEPSVPGEQGMWTQAKGEGGDQDLMSKWWKVMAVLTVLAGGALAGYLVAVWPYLTRDPIGPPQGELPQTVEGGATPTSGLFVGHSESS